MRRGLSKPHSNETEAANRAEASALLIRARYRVYRPEADCYGEDLVVRTPGGRLRSVQLKSRPTVNWGKYGNGRAIWMLFPDPKGGQGRDWFLVPHDKLYEWVKRRHRRAPKWNKSWTYPHISEDLRAFLRRFRNNRW